MKKMKTVLIVGGGTSGLTIANRLQDKFKTTIVEKVNIHHYLYFTKYLCQLDYFRQNKII